MTLTVTTAFAGPGRTSAATTLVDAADIFPASAGTWTYDLPATPLAAVPPWATEIVVRAEATCAFAIGGSGFTYGPAEFRRPIDRPTSPSTTTPTVPIPTPTAAPASAVAGSPTFTG